MACRRVENVEHTIQPPVIRGHERVIKNDGGRASLLDQHLSKGKAGEGGNLFLRPHAEDVKIFLAAGPLTKPVISRLSSVAMSALGNRNRR